MNVQERLGRRKEEARAGLDAARGKTAAPPVANAAEVAAFAKTIENRPCVLVGTGPDALAAAAVVKILGKREGGRDVALAKHARFDNPVIIEKDPLWLTAALD